MGFFNWAAPLVRMYGNRFDDTQADEIASWLRPAVAEGGRILDVGGGSGQLAHLLAERLDANVTVLDPTPEMLDHVITDGRVDAVSGVAEEIPFAEDSFDAVVVTDAFHHFRRQAAAVREFGRVVRHNGLVLVLDLDPRVKLMPLVVWAARAVGEPGTFMTPAQMCGFMSTHGIEGECTYEDGHAAAAGFRPRTASYRFLGCVQKAPIET